MELVPGHPRYFFTPLARKDQELNDGSVSAADLPGASYNFLQFVVRQHSVTRDCLQWRFDPDRRRGFQDRTADASAEEPLDCLQQLVSRMITPFDRRFED